LAANELKSAKALPAGSVAAVICDFKKSPEYVGLKPKTQTDYARQLDHLGKAVGPYQDPDIKRSNIVKLRNKLATKGNRTADLFVSVVCRAFRVGMDLGYCETNPAADISRINKAQSYKAWPKAARESFEASSPPELLIWAYKLGLYTSLRLGDVLALTWPNYQEGCFVTRHTKLLELAGLTDGEDYIPAARPLRELLDRTPRTSMMIVARADGRKWNERHFSAVFRDHLDAIGLDHLHFHGLRKTTAKALAEAGATSKEIAAITGHRTLSMVEL
jgi:integrase